MLMWGWNLFLVFFINGSYSICLVWLKEKTDISKFITYIRKQIQDFNNTEKCNFIKNLPTLGWDCNIIINEASPLFTKSSPPKVSPK